MTEELSADADPAGRMEADVAVERTLEALREDAEVAHVLLGFSSALAEVRSIDQTLEIAVRMIPEIMGCDRCFVAAMNRADQRLYLMNSSGFTPEESAAFHRLLQSSDPFPLLRRAIQDRSPVIVEDANNDPRISPEEAAERRLGAFMRVPLIRPGQQIAALGIEYRRPRAFGSKEESLGRGIARQLGVALANARQFNLLASLSRFGPRIATRFRLQPVSEEVARGAADLLSGDGARLYLIDHGRESLFPAASAGQVPRGRFDRIGLMDDPWAPLLAGRTVMISHVRDEARNEGDPAAMIAAPVPAADGSVLGAVVVFFDRHMALGQDETDALSVLASLSALALENAQSFERQRRVARSLQQGLLTTETPVVPGCRISAVYEPAGAEADVGGDFYDMFQLAENSYGLVVGDVSGKGAEAAALTAQAKYMLRAFASRNRGPASVLFHLNNALAVSFGEDRFATLVYLVYDTNKRGCILSNAGHPAPLLFKGADGSVRAFELPGTVLGAFPEQQFEQTSFKLEAGDVFLAYTDGLIETRREDGEMFGRERVERALRDVAGRRVEPEPARAIYEEATDFGLVNDDTVVLTLVRSED
jgi:serine phosphatase RsbU (regulator of sigma subunit)